MANLPLLRLASQLSIAKLGVADAPERLAIEFLMQMLDEGRILAPHHWFEILNGADHTSGFSLQGGLAPAVQSGIIRFDKHPVAQLHVDHNRLECWNFHHLPLHPRMLTVDSRPHSPVRVAPLISVDPSRARKRRLLRPRRKWRPGPGVVPHRMSRRVFSGSFCAATNSCKCCAPFKNQSRHRHPLEERCQL